MKIFLTSLLLTIGLFRQEPARAQSHELQQLILNVEKLSQFQAILDQMRKGYQIVSKGYTTVKDLTQGNFSLHKVFLDKLLEVSPTVKQYKKVAEVISLQKALVKEYGKARTHFTNLKIFDKNELGYFSQVYDNLFDRSLKNLDELLMVITAQKLRMNDAERLAAIDRIHADMQDKMNFLRDFNNRTALMAQQKIRELRDMRSIQRLYGIQGIN